MTDTTDLKEALLNLATRISNSATEPAHASIAIKAADALDARDRTIERLEAENNQLWFAYEELRFQIYWRVDGMNTEQALVHAKARTTEARAALKGQTP
jgi:hypothetical protein